jgi:hypothetical protein
VCAPIATDTVQGLSPSGRENRGVMTPHTPFFAMVARLDN